MKKVISLVLALVLCLCLVVPVCAEEFVPSITGKEAPTIVPVKDDEGNNAIGVIKDANGNIIGYVDEKCLVITPVSKAKTSELIPDDAEILLLDVYDKLLSGAMSLPYEKLNAGLDASKMVIRDLFDASWLCEGENIAPAHPECPESIAPKNVTLTIIFNLGIGKNTDIYCMSYKNGAWNPIVKTVNNGDGTVTCTFEDFCPIAFAVKSGSDVPPSQTGDEANLGLWIGLMSVSVVALAAVLLLSRRKVAR